MWAILTAAAPGHDLDEDQLAIRAELITDLDFDAARSAAIHLARSTRWVPSVAEFREAVVGSCLPTVAELIDEVLTAAAGGVQRYGDMPPLSSLVSPEAAALAHALGGWVRVGTEDVEVIRAHALKLAPHIIDRSRRNLLVGPPAGPAVEAGEGRRLELPDLRLPEEDA